MAIFNGEITFKVTFKDLNIPVGFGMTNAILWHTCAEQVYVRSPWSKLSKNYKKENFKVQKIDENISYMNTIKPEIIIQKCEKIINDKLN